MTTWKPSYRYTCSVNVLIKSSNDFSISAIYGDTSRANPVRKNKQTPFVDIFSKEDNKSIMIWTKSKQETIVIFFPEQNS